MQTLTGTGTVATTGAAVNTTSTLPDTVSQDNPATGANESTVTISHQVTVGGSPGAPQINIAIVLDATNSTAVNPNGDAGFDVNGDGVIRNGSSNPNGTSDPNDVLYNSATHDSILLAEKIAAKTLFQHYIDAGYDPSQINISLISFTSQGGTPASGYINHGTFDLEDQSSFNSAVDGIMPRSGQTGYQAGLDGVNAAWSANGVTAATANHVIFLTDGGNNHYGTGAPGRATLQNNYGADITAIGFGPPGQATGATNSMNVIDNTGGSTYLSSGAQLATLTDVIVQPPTQAPLLHIRVTFEYVDINGNPATTTVTYPANSASITATPTGYIVNNQSVTLVPPPRAISGVSDEIKVTFYTRFTDGSEVPTTGVIGYLDVVCFTSGTRIRTIRGEVAVEDLEAGDLVLTLDNGYQPLRWIGSRHLSAAELEIAPRLRPILIRAGALGLQQPDQDLEVSPQHRVLARSVVAERMFGQREVLAAAKHLLSMEGIEVSATSTGVTYWHFMFDDHQIVFSNGAATESLFAGPIALKSVSPEARREILEVFPLLCDADPVARNTARTLIPGRAAQNMAMRMQRNGRSMVAAPYYAS